MLTKIRYAQSTAEYAILLALVVAAAMGIQNEVRRAIQSRVHDAAMELSGGKQYEPTDLLKTTTNQQSTRDTKENYVEPGSNAPWITTNEQSSADYTSRTTQ